jgi:hypothetical protein
MKKQRKTYSEMTTAELREATREFDEEIKRFPPGRALTAAQRAVNRKSKARGITRSQLISQSFREQVKKAG